MKLYKLTDQNGMTFNSTQWGPNVTHTASGEGDLCGPGYIHAYTHPLVAVWLHPIHAAYPAPRLWEAKGRVRQSDHGLNVVVTRLTTTRELDCPDIPLESLCIAAIYAALSVPQSPGFTSWAETWLSGKDRSSATAAEAARRAEARAAEMADAAVQAAVAAAWAGAEAAMADALARAAAARAAAAAAVKHDTLPLTDIISAACFDFGWGDET